MRMNLFAVHFESDDGARSVYYVSQDCLPALHAGVVSGQLGERRIVQVEKVKVDSAPTAPALNS